MRRGDTIDRLRGAGFDERQVEALAAVLRGQDRFPLSLTAVTWVFGIVVAVLVAAIGWVAAEVGDTRGELLAAIQANADRIDANRDRIDANRDRIDALNQRLGETNERLARIETLLEERLPERR